MATNSFPFLLLELLPLSRNLPGNAILGLSVAIGNNYCYGVQQGNLFYINELSSAGNEISSIEITTVFSQLATDGTNLYGLNSNSVIETLPLKGNTTTVVSTLSAAGGFLNVATVVSGNYATGFAAIGGQANFAEVTIATGTLSLQLPSSCELVATFTTNTEIAPKTTVAATKGTQSIKKSSGSTNLLGLWIALAIIGCIIIVVVIILVVIFLRRRQKNDRSSQNGVIDDSLELDVKENKKTRKTKKKRNRTTKKTTRKRRKKKEKKNKRPKKKKIKTKKLFKSLRKIQQCMVL